MALAVSTSIGCRPPPNVAYNPDSDQQYRDGHRRAKTGSNNSDTTTESQQIDSHRLGHRFASADDRISSNPRHHLNFSIYLILESNRFDFD